MSEFVYSNNNNNKGNNKHYGKGSSKGGQFAPKTGGNVEGISSPALKGFAQNFLKSKNIKVINDGRPRYDVESNTIYAPEGDPVTLAHEFFHALDYNYTNSLSSLSGRTFEDALNQDLYKMNIDNISNGLLESFKRRMFMDVLAEHPNFPREAIEKAVNDTLDIEMKYMPQIRKQRELMKKLSGSERDEASEIDSKLYAKKRGERDHAVPKEIANSISNALDRARYVHGYGILSDVMMAIGQRLGVSSQFTDIVGVSHNNDYWNMDTGKYRGSSRAGVEIFAHAGTLKYLKPPLYRKLKQILPVATAEFDNIIERIIK